VIPAPAKGMYDPQHGRWLQRDPVGTRPDKRGRIDPTKQYADSTNLYEYAESSPAKKFDPMGMSSYGSTECWRLINLVEEWAASLGRPCTAAVVRHFLRGDGNDLPCPSSCSTLLTPHVREHGERIFREQALKKNPCSKGACNQERLKHDENVYVNNASGDLGSAFGKFTFKPLRISGWARCVSLKYIAIAIPEGIPVTLRGGCCTKWWGVATGFVDEWIDYDEGAAGNTPLARLLNDCAAFLEDIGLGKPFWVKNCKAGVWIEGNNCK